MASKHLVFLLVLVVWIGCPLALAADELTLNAPTEASNGTASLPNVVLIIIDALRADRLTATRDGVAVMPYLSHMAAQGAWFTSAMAPCSWTRPSVASILTSMYIEAHQVSTPFDMLSDKVETMASFLKKAGYMTMGVQTNWHLTAINGFAQGFVAYDDLVANVPPALAVTDDALQLIQETSTPFFLYVHYLDVHCPYWPPEAYRQLFGYPNLILDSMEQAIVEDFQPYLIDQVDYMLGVKPSRDFPELSPVARDAVRLLFDGECRYTDEQIGRLIDSIRSEFPNTFFVVTADHGDHFWEHGWLGHGQTMYEPVLRVPLFIAGPGLTPATSDANVETIDILPTLASLLGLSARSTWQGRSLLAPRDLRNPTFSYTRGGLPPRTTDCEMVKVDSIKLIRDRRTGAAELYDLAHDPDETTNLAAQYPEQVAQLKALLDAHHEQNIRARVRVADVIPNPGGWIEEGTCLTLTAPSGMSYQWIKNGQPIADDPLHIVGADTRTLTLNQLIAEDSGTYECEYADGVWTFLYTKPYVFTVLPFNSVPALDVAGSCVLITMLFGARLFLRGRCR